MAEVLTALTIGSMILVAVLGIYERLDRSSEAIKHRVVDSAVPREILQRIAEDLDEIIAGPSDTVVAFTSKLEGHGFTSSKLEITKSIYDKENKKQTFEKIVWQSSYDYDSDTPGLVLYRSHSGIALEDKLLDESKDNWQRELFVPICNGVTFFQIQTFKGDVLIDNWAGSSAPKGIIVTISFAQPYETLTETYEVPDWQKVTRTIAIDRTRKIKFKIEKKEDEQNDG